MKVLSFMWCVIGYAICLNVLYVRVCFMLVYVCVWPWIWIICVPYFSGVCLSSFSVQDIKCSLHADTKKYELFKVKDIDNYYCSQK